MKAPALAIALGAALIAVTASGHTIVKTPPPIGTQADLLVEPCGCDFVNTPNKCPATYTITPLVAGSQAQITWTELINHAGKFRVAISTMAPDAVTEADLDAHVLYEGVDNNTTVPKDINQTILVPETPCTKCTLQVRQAASDGPNPFYYSCAAITILPSGTGGAGGASSSTTGAATSGAGTTGAATTATSGAGGPIYQPEPNTTGCAVMPAVNASDAAAFGWLVPAIAALVLAARRKR